MTQNRPSLRTFRAGVLILAAMLLIALALPAQAAVELTEFTATAQADGSIRVYWAAATELDTASYQLFRAESSPGNWSAPIYQVAAGGSLSPANYSYIDTAVTPGVTYWYMLSDISVRGDVGENGPTSARVPLGNETPTSTPTATATTNTNIPTATTGPGAGSGGVDATATFTPPPPTATRRFTNTPTGAPVGTPVLTAPTSPVVVNRVTPTVLPGAALATPTGQALVPTVAPAALPPTVPPATVPPLPSPTVAAVAEAPVAAMETATPVPTREVTPIIFAASETREAGATPSAVQTVAAQGNRNASAALVIGGAALGLAGVAAAAWLFLRSRKA